MNVRIDDKKWEIQGLGRNGERKKDTDYLWVLNWFRRIDCEWWVYWDVFRIIFYKCYYSNLFMSRESNLEECRVLGRPTYSLSGEYATNWPTRGRYTTCLLLLFTINEEMDRWLDDQSQRDKKGREYGWDMKLIKRFSKS